MKLLYYEFKKCWTQGFVLSLLILLLASLALNYIQLNQNTQPEFSMTKRYLDEKARFDQMGMSQAIDTLDHDIRMYQLFEEYESYQSIPPIIRLHHNLEVNEIFSNPDFIKAYHDYTTKESSSAETILVYSSLLSYYQAIQRYPDYLNQIKINVETMQSMPAWKQYSSEKQAYYIQLADHYQKLSSVKLERTNTLALEALVQNSSLLFFNLILVLFMVNNVFASDEKNDMLRLQLITKNGRIKTTVAKLFVISFNILLITVLVYGINLVMLEMQYGLLDFNVSIQSFPSLYEAPYAMNALSWLMMVLGMSVLVSLAVAMIYSIFYHLFRVKQLSMLLFLLFFALNVLVSVLIKPTSAFGALYYLNFFNGLNSFLYLGSHIAVDVGVQPVPVVKLLLGMNIFIVITGMIVLTVQRLSLHRYELKHPFKFNALQEVIHCHTSLLRHELYKLFFQKKAILYVLLLVAGLSYFASLTLQGRTIFNQNQKLAAYYQEHGGKLDETKKQWIEKQADAYEALEAELNQKTQERISGQLSQEDYNAYFNTYRAQSEDKGLFNSLYRQYQRIDHDYLVYPNGYQAILSMNTSVREVRTSMILIAGLIFVVSILYTQDQQHAMDNLYKTSYNGNRILRNTKIKLMVIFTVFVWLISLGIELYSFSKLYPMKSWTAPLSSIMSESLSDEMLKLPENIKSWPILGYYILMQITRLFGLFTVSSLGLYLSKRMNNILFVILSGLSIFLIPMFLALNGYSFAYLFSSFELVMGNYFYYYHYNLIKLFILLALLGLLFADLARSTQDD